MKVMGAYEYRVTAIDAEGLPVPGATVEVLPAEGGFAWPADELDEYLEGQMRNPEFARRWHWICAVIPGKLPIDGHEYHRRQMARKKRRRH
jgi:hypothetical protein